MVTAAQMRAVAPPSEVVAPSGTAETTRWHRSTTRMRRGDSSSQTAKTLPSDGYTGRQTSQSVRKARRQAAAVYVYAAAGTGIGLTTNTATTARPLLVQLTADALAPRPWTPPSRWAIPTDLEGRLKAASTSVQPAIGVVEATAAH